MCLMSSSKLEREGSTWGEGEGEGGGGGGRGRGGHTYVIFVMTRWAYLYIQWWGCGICIEGLGSLPCVEMYG